MRPIVTALLLLAALAAGAPAAAASSSPVVDVTVVFNAGSGLVAQCPADVSAPGAPVGAAVQVMREDGATVVCQYGRNEGERATIGAAAVLLAFGFLLALYAIVKAAR